MAKGAIKILLTSIFLIGIGFFLYVRYLEHTGIFFPTRPLSASPADFGIAFDEVRLRTEDGVQIHGWFLKNPPNRSAFIYLHGNAGNIADRLEKLALMMKLGTNILIIDYRGFGQSEGTPTEQGLYKDARAAYDYLLTRPDVDSKKIVVYGASLGGVVAIDLAAHRPLAGLIVDSTFTCAADMARRLYPFIPSFFLSVKMCSDVKIKEITIPKLFIHSPEDEVIAFSLGKKLYESAPPPKEFLETHGRHNDNHIASQAQWFGGIKDFLKEIHVTESQN